MISYATAVGLCAASYDPSAVWDAKWTGGNVYLCLRRTAELDLFTFRGSDDDIDWLRDLQGWPALDPLVGYCHSGFLAGMQDATAEILKALSGRPYALLGHSLGGSHANIAGGRLAALGTPPSAIICFGCPNPGFAKLSTILRGSGAYITLYRNGPDPVPDVPIYLPPLFDYQKPVPNTMVHGVPDDPDDVLAYHLIASYQRATGPAP
ncbi:MAG: lipase family protein [Acidobacteriaceae bacterium]